MCWLSWSGDCTISIDVSHAWIIQQLKNAASEECRLLVNERARDKSVTLETERV